MTNMFEDMPVIVVLTLDNINESLQIAQVLTSEGLTNLEVTLRTPNAIECIKALIKEFPNANIGAGTITNVQQLIHMQDIGCNFAISPGFTTDLIQESKKLDIAYLPGASTPSEIMQLSQLDVKFQKFFHAKNAGGATMLKTYANLFPNVSFCPTGGISESDFMDYLALDNVPCLGGSWMVNTKTMSLDDIKQASRSIVAKL